MISTTFFKRTINKLHVKLSGSIWPRLSNLRSTFNPFCAGGRLARNMSRHVKAVLYNQSAPLPQTTAQGVGGGSLREDHPNLN